MLQWSKDSAAFWAGSGNLRPVKLGNGSIRKAFDQPKWSKLDLHDSGLNEIEESYLMSICSTFPWRSFIPQPFHKIMAANNQRSPGAKPRPGWISKIWQPKYAQISTNLGWMRDSAPIGEPFRLDKRKLIWKVKLDVEFACPIHDVMACNTITAMICQYLSASRVNSHWAVQLDSPRTSSWPSKRLHKNQKILFQKYVQDPNLESCHAPAGTCQKRQNDPTPIFSILDSSKSVYVPHISAYSSWHLHHWFSPKKKTPCKNWVQLVHLAIPCALRGGHNPLPLSTFAAALQLQIFIWNQRCPRHEERFETSVAPPSSWGLGSQLSFGNLYGPLWASKSAKVRF